MSFESVKSAVWRRFSPQTPRIYEYDDNSQAQLLEPSQPRAMELLVAAEALLQAVEKRQNKSRAQGSDH
jgi:hypothetical protein